MVPKVIDRRLLRNTSLLLVLLVLTTVMAGRPSHAANASKAVGLDNTQGNFATGVFQRTALGPQDLEDDVLMTPLPGYEQKEIHDEPGMVQLAPAGVLKPWAAFSPPLPVPVTNAGVTAMGNFIYVIGGILQGSGGRSDQIYWAKVDPTSGNLVGDWQATPMPPAQLILDNDVIFTYENTPPYDCKSSTANLAARSDVGVASLDVNSSTGYIYIIGGVFKGADCITELSTAVIQRATVNKTTGALTWTTLSSSVSLPSPEFPDNGAVSTRLLGADSISTTVVPYRESNGTLRYFLYVMGGKSRFIKGEYESLFFLKGEPKDRALASVFYTEIDPATGNFKHPVSGSTSTVWVRDSDIQLRNIPQENQGLWGAGISGTTILDGTQMKSMIYVAGGQLDTDTLPVFNNFVYRADLGANGVLNWGDTDRAKTVGPDEVGIVGRRGMGLVASNGKLYFIAGNTTNTPTGIENSVPTAFYDENGNLIKLDDTNFIIGTDDRVLNVGDTDGALQPWCGDDRRSLGWHQRDSGLDLCHRGSG
ncbi:hypothetical protein OSCT_2766 [Oscillochloris trichoides DG-6]|uniref:Uncharacterized protein n=1 Tax=Oscillochloris trichoides DG-6 TaxID=765420 RepID=E1IHG5_9CHLR|nr:hypothetical protein [Oscillochloris trichoides]EFO79371.1 hypothetical protein OSCT_2766 [Oscillochloris trichoides DG-6]